MKSKIDEMLSSYGLSQESNILHILDDFPEDEIRKYCWQVLSGYPDLKKKTGLSGWKAGTLFTVLMINMFLSQTISGVLI